MRCQIANVGVQMRQKRTSHFIPEGQLNAMIFSPAAIADSCLSEHYFKTKKIVSPLINPLITMFYKTGSSADATSSGGSIPLNVGTGPSVCWHLPFVILSHYIADRCNLCCLLITFQRLFSFDNKPFKWRSLSQDATVLELYLTVSLNYFTIVFICGIVLNYFYTF